jgi:hypothetical protein
MAGGHIAKMRPRAIQSVAGLDPSATPFVRFEQFTRMVLQIPKEEADKEIKNAPQDTRRFFGGDYGDR